MGLRQRRRFGFREGLFVHNFVHRLAESVYQTKQGRNKKFR